MRELTQNDLLLGRMIQAAEESNDVRGLLADLLDAISWVISGYESKETRQTLAEDIAKRLPEAVEEYYAQRDEPCDDPECPVHGVRH